MSEDEEESVQKKTTSGQLSSFNQNPTEEEKEEAPVQAKSDPGHNSKISNNLAPRLSSFKNTGQPLSVATRKFFEPRFGVNFSQVRVHSDASAAGFSRDLNARAATVGRNVYFGANEYEPETPRGRNLIAHELTHVIQQSKQNTFIQRQTSTIDSETELMSSPELSSDPDRLRRLDELLDQINAETLDTIHLRSEVDALPPASSQERILLEETLNSNRLMLIQSLEARIQLLQSEIESLNERIGPNPVCSPDHPEIEALGNELLQRQNELRQHQNQLRPLKRWQMRKEIGTLETEIQRIDQELSTLPQVSDPNDLLSEMLRLRRIELEQRKNELAASLTSTATEFEQWDSRWGAIRYGVSSQCTNIKAAGCGPTSLAMVLNYLYQEDPESLAATGTMEIVTPPETAKYAETHGRVCNNGTAGDTMVTQVHTGWPGFYGKRISLDEAIAQLRRGNLVIFLCRSCTGHTQTGGSKGYGGHFMVLNGVNEAGSICNVLDPGAKESSDIATITRTELQSHNGGFWIVERL